MDWCNIMLYIYYPKPQITTPNVLILYESKEKVVEYFTTQSIYITYVLFLTNILSIVSCLRLPLYWFILSIQRYWPNGSDLVFFRVVVLFVASYMQISRFILYRNSYSLLKYNILPCTSINSSFTIILFHSNHFFLHGIK